MKKLLFVWVAIAVGVILVPRAYAAPFTFDHISGTYTLTSDNPADQGSNVSVVNAYIQDGSATKSLAITGFEYYLGGSSVSGAAGDTPAQFLLASNGWTYQLGAGASNATSTAGTGWTNNLVPTANGAVKPTGASTTDYLSAVTLVNSSSSGYCYTGEILLPGAQCDVELLVTANYGGAQGSKSTTFIYGYAVGAEGTGSWNGTSWATGNAAEAQGMQETIDINIAPEPNSVALLGTGFGLLGLSLFLRKQFAGSEPSTIQSPIA